jgi:hypothetical protein
MLDVPCDTILPPALAFELGRDAEIRRFGLSDLVPGVPAPEAWCEICGGGFSFGDVIEQIDPEDGPAWWCCYGCAASMHPRSEIEAHFDVLGLAIFPLDC